MDRLFYDNTPKLVSVSPELFYDLQGQRLAGRLLSSATVRKPA